MAKAQSKQQSEQEFYAELLSQLSPEERAAIESMTGQQMGGSGNKRPVVRLNYQERKDLNGRKIPKGNWVLGQRLGKKEGAQVLEEAGVDLGPELEVVILKRCMQYSFIPQNGDVKKRCSSQILTEANETPRGHNLGFVCNNKECPRRAEGLDKNDRCSCQWVLFVRLPAGTKMPDGTDCPVAMLYVKGESFMPFKEYYDELKLSVPQPHMTTTLVGYEEKYHGSVLYFVLKFAKGAPLTLPEFNEANEMLRGIATDLKAYKDQWATKQSAPKIQNQTSGTLLPAGSSDGEGAREVPAALADADDDIVF